MSLCTMPLHILCKVILVAIICTFTIAKLWSASQIEAAMKELYLIKLAKTYLFKNIRSFNTFSIFNECNF